MNIIEYLQLPVYCGVVLLGILLYNREENIIAYLKRKKISKALLPSVICFIISFLFSLRLSLSPFNNAVPGLDSSVFLYIGQAMTKGLVPYRDLFDHKGIALYFIEYLGYLIGRGSSVGVWLLELANVFAFTLILYKTASLLTERHTVRYLAIYFTQYICSESFFAGEGGNLSEEYALPWIAITLYFTLKFFIKGEFRLWNVAVIGAGFVIVALLRVNMVAPWGVLVLAILISLLKKKDFSSLFQCAGAFIGGAAAVTVPVIIYTLTTGSLQAMINDYLLFNFSYTGSEAGLKTVHVMISFLSGITLATVFFIVSTVMNNKSDYVWVNISAFVISLLSASISGRRYPHYAIVLLPFVLVPALHVLDLLFKAVKEHTAPIKSKLLIYPLLLICCGAIMVQPLSYTVVYNYINAENSIADAVAYLEDNTAPEDDVLVLGNDCRIYYLANRTTKNKFFFQTPPIDISEEMYSEFEAELQTQQPDYAVVSSSVTEITGLTGEGFQKTIDYFEAECQKGIYSKETVGNHQIYIKR